VKRSLKITAAVAAVLLLFGLLTVALNRIFNDTGWLYKEYLSELDDQVRKEYGISAEDASRVLARMMYYSTGRAGDLDVTIVENGEEVPFFNERELSHMRDVRALTKTILWMGAVALLIGAAVPITLKIRKKDGALRTFCKAYLIAFGVLALIILILGVWIAIDFDSFWTVFHIVFLDLESSTFNPAESRMVRICPAELFSDFIGVFAIYAAVLVLIAAALCVLHLVRKGKKK
jgi:integral membrane protein (TIGR01906 family)